jgi:hypothetical protein
MATEVLVVLSVVIPDSPDTPPDVLARIRDLHGRELPGVPGSWVTRVAVHPLGGPTGEDSTGPARPDSAALTDDEAQAELDDDFGVTDRDS